MPKEKGIEDKLTTSIPPWSLAICATFFCVGLTMRILGIDFSGPINTVGLAWAESINSSCAQMAVVLPEHLDEILSRLSYLESISHESSLNK